MSEELMVCPYDGSHIVTKLRMASHLVKCQKNHPNINLATCLFDFLHRVPPEEFREHLKVCSSRSKFKTRFCFDEPTDPMDPNLPTVYLSRSPWERKSTKEEEDTSTTDGSISSDFATISLEDSKEHKGKAKGKGKSAGGKTKKSSKPKEESWDTPSSDDSDEENIENEVDRPQSNTSIQISSDEKKMENEVDRPQSNTSIQLSSDEETVSEVDTPLSDTSSQLSSDEETESEVDTSLSDTTSQSSSDEESESSATDSSSVYACDSADEEGFVSVYAKQEFGHE